MSQNTGTVLITGGSGLIGRRLTELLLEKGYRVIHLGRSLRSTGSVKCYQWNISKGTIDDAALKEADYIINLAGAGVADKAWTMNRKKEIMDSRIKSTEMIFEKLQSSAHTVKAFISASAIGIYGNTGAQLIAEDAPLANTFLGVTCQLWEKAVDSISSLGVRTVKIRTGDVLSKEGGALPVFAFPVKLFLGSPLGNGEQYMSWIHLDDLCGIYMKALEDNSMEGAYNAVAPHPVKNKDMIKALAGTLHRPMFMPAVPAFLLRMILGERAGLVLDSTKVSSKKIMDAGYLFKYPIIDEALASIYSSFPDVSLKKKNIYTNA